MTYFTLMKLSIFDYLLGKGVLVFLGILSAWTVSASTMEECYRKADGYRAYYEEGCSWGYVSPQWISGTGDFWYTSYRDGRKSFLRVNSSDGTKEPAFDHDHVAEELNRLSGEKANPAWLPFDVITGTPESLRFRVKDKEFCYDTVGKTLSPAPESREIQHKPNNPNCSPDGMYEAFVKENDLFLRNSKNGMEVRLSSNGTAENPYCLPVFWAPDSKGLVCCRRVTAPVRHITLVESSPKDSVQPRERSIPYVKPGDPLDVVRPVLFGTEADTGIEISFPEPEQQFSLGGIRWLRDSSGFTFDYNKRGHGSYIVYKVDRENASKARLLIEESFPTFVNYTRLYRHDLEDTGEIVWISERDGWRHLYLLDAETGKVVRQLTSGEWIVKKVLHVDAGQRTVFFIGCGQTPGEDPYLEKLYRVSLDGGTPICLTPTNATHGIDFSPDYSCFVDTASRVDMPPETSLRDARTGREILKLEKSDITPALKRGWRPPTVFCGKGRDGQTDIWGIIAFPPNLVPGRKYPVIEYIYAGPHDSHVPKSFNMEHEMVRYTELGFIMVMIDGMGTSNRSKKFHDVCWKNLKDAGFPDRIAWMKQAAKKYPVMDLSRVGIYGVSAGGQNALSALLFHPEWYKVGVSSCGCHDNRMDKIWWNEQWMGYPVDKSYEECSNVVNAGKLQGKLMLILGEIDDNVDPASTRQVIHALEQAGKDFEFVLITGAGHTMGGKFGERKRRDFFVKHLQGMDPPNRNAAHVPAAKTRT